MRHTGLRAPDLVFNTSSDTPVNSGQIPPTYKQETDNVGYDEDTEAEERLLSDTLESSRHQSIVRKALACFTLTSTRVLALGAFCLILLFSIAANIDEAWDTDLKSSLSSLQDKFNKGIESVHSGSSKSCEDPWAMPGYMWYGDHRFDARWVSYDSFSEDVLNPDAAKSIDPEKTGFRPKKAAPHLDQLPMQYTKLFSQKKVRTNNTDLEFLRNKHIVVLGSSMDREATMMFCNAYEGAAPADLKMHHSLRCHFPDYNLTISQWMHFGMSQAPWHHGGDKESKAYSFEDRVDTIFKGMAERDGKPDLLVFTSGLWDLQYLDKHLRKIDRTHPVDRQFQYVRPDQLVWHRARLVQAVDYLRASFPDSFLMYRTTTEPDKTRGDGDEEATAVFQLNQSARLVMKKLQVPLLHWAELVKGNHEHRDVHHFNTVSRANAVYNEMLFWHLKQISRPQVDTSCWLDR